MQLYWLHIFFCLAMSNLRLIYLLPFVLLTVALPSCKRKEVIYTRLTRIQHSWKLVKTATDVNGNGQIDASEIQPIDDAFDNTLTFNADYTGKETVVANSVTTDYPFTWTMDVNMDTITRNGIGHNVIKYYLADISSIRMELTTTTSIGLAAYIYEIK